MLLQINDETLKYEGTQAIHIERLTINKGEKQVSSDPVVQGNRLF